MGILGIAGGGVLLLVAGAFLYTGGRGVKRYLDFRRVTDREGSDIQDGELVGLEGEVVGTGRLTSPLSGTQCVAHTWLMEEYERAGEHSRDWRPKHTAAEADRFELETTDGTTVTVDPPDDIPPQAGMNLNRKELFRVPASDDPPAPVRRLIDEGVIEANEASVGEGLDEAAGTHSTTLGTRRYRERTLTDGDSVHLYGKAERTGGDVTITEGDLFVLSDREKFSLQRNTFWASVLLVFIGVAALYFAALLLL